MKFQKIENVKKKGQMDFDNIRDGILKTGFDFYKNLIILENPYKNPDIIDLNMVKGSFIINERIINERKENKIKIIKIEKKNKEIVPKTRFAINQKSLLLITLLKENSGILIITSRSNNISFKYVENRLQQTNKDYFYSLKKGIKATLIGVYSQEIGGIFYIQEFKEDTKKTNIEYKILQVHSYIPGLKKFFGEKFCKTENINSKLKFPNFVGLGKKTDKSYYIIKNYSSEKADNTIPILADFIKMYEVDALIENAHEGDSSNKIEEYLKNFEQNFYCLNNEASLMVTPQLTGCCIIVFKKDSNYYIAHLQPPKIKNLRKLFNDFLCKYKEKTIFSFLQDFYQNGKYICEIDYLNNIFREKTDILSSIKKKIEKTEQFTKKQKKYLKKYCYNASLCILLEILKDFLKIEEISRCQNNNIQVKEIEKSINNMKPSEVCQKLIDEIKKRKNSSYCNGKQVGILLDRLEKSKDMLKQSNIMGKRLNALENFYKESKRNPIKIDKKLENLFKMDLFKMDLFYEKKDISFIERLYNFLFHQIKDTYFSSGVFLQEILIKIIAKEIKNIDAYFLFGKEDYLNNVAYFYGVREKDSWIFYAHQYKRRVNFDLLCSNIKKILF